MLPFLFLIGLAVYAGSRFAAAAQERTSTPSSRAGGGRIGAGAPYARDPGPPGPISVLGAYLSRGEYPPPPVVMCAIAEAETIGRTDLAHDIIRTFIAPVVYKHELANARDANVQAAPAQQYAPPPPPGYAPSQQAQPAPMDAQGGIDFDRLAQQNPRAAFSSLPRADEPLPVPMPPMRQQPMQAMAQPQGAPKASDQPSDADLIAQMLGRPLTATEAGSPPSPDSAPIVTAGEVSFENVSLERERVRVPIPVRKSASDVTVLDAAGRPVGAHYVAPSPIDAVPDAIWAAFAERIARERPTYQSSRHVGQYRQRKERLVELGIDPSTLVGNPIAQRAAFDIDMGDAFRHAREGGMLNEHLRRLIAVPGVSDLCKVSLSGILGVIQCAGIDHAYGWLESQQDRKKYTYTTKMFLHTNGAF